MIHGQKTIKNLLIKMIVSMILGVITLHASGLSNHSNCTYLDNFSQPLSLTLYYDKNSQAITKNSAEKLEDIVLFIKKYPALKVIVYGHTSAKEGESKSESLSKERALNVKRYLVKQGVFSSNISTDAKGSSQPVQEKGMVEIPELNRRVEIKFYNGNWS